MKNILAIAICFLPHTMAFIASMLALGSYDADLLSIGFLIASMALYWPCCFMYSRIWED